MSAAYSVNESQTQIRRVNAALRFMNVYARLFAQLLHGEHFLGWVARTISSATGSTPNGAGSVVTDSGVAKTLALWLSNSSTVSAPLSRN